MGSNDNKKWQAILLNQRLANTKKWIREIENAQDVSVLINNEYENILRALEAALNVQNAIDLAYQLIELLHPVVIDFADWNRWLIYLYQLLNSPSFSEPFKQANLLIQIGDVKGKMGELSEAERNYLEGIATFRELNKNEELAVALGRLATIYSQKGNLVEATNLCNQALEIANKLNDPVISSRINLILSFIYYHGRNYQASLASAKFAYENFRSMQMQRDATKALLNIVAISNEMGNWLDVETQTRSLLNDIDKSSDITILCQLKNTMGVAAYNQRKYDIAETSWHEALLLYTQINDSSEIAGIYNNLGMVYTKLKEWAASQDMLLKAISAYDDLGDNYYKANAQDNLADLYAEQGDFQEACVVLQAAVDELKSIKPSPHVEQLISHIQEKLNRLRKNILV